MPSSLNTTRLGGATRSVNHLNITQRLVTQGELSRQRKEAAIREKEAKDLEVLKKPAVNQKYNSRISCRNIISRINAEMKAKQARLKKMKEDDEAKRKQEEEEAIAIRESKSQKKQAASSLVARQQERETQFKKKWNQ